MTQDELYQARQIARWSHFMGTPLSPEDQELVRKAIEFFGPEQFYMDGELFA